jgi:putative Holliday junction resolvase
MPQGALPRRSDHQALAEIAELARREGVEGFVVGDPVNVDGTRGEASERVRRFADKLRAACGLPVHLVAETLTTVAARERLEAAGVDWRRHPGRLDAVAAQIVLEEFLAGSTGSLRE